MKEIFLATFYGYDIVIKIPKDKEDFDFSKKWESYIQSQIRYGIEEQKEALYFKNRFQKFILILFKIL